MPKCQNRQFFLYLNAAGPLEAAILPCIETLDRSEQHDYHVIRSREKAVRLVFRCAQQEIVSVGDWRDLGAALNIQASSASIPIAMGLGGAGPTWESYDGRWGADNQMWNLQ